MKGLSIKNSVRWNERIKLVERRAELARQVLAGARDDLLEGHAGDVFDALGMEVAYRARQVSERFAEFGSPHEAYGVLAEEVDEFFDEVKKKSHLRSQLAMRNEALDVATVAVRIMALYSKVSS